MAIRSAPRRRACSTIASSACACTAACSIVSPCEPSRKASARRYCVAAPRSSSASGEPSSSLLGGASVCSIASTCVASSAAQAARSSVTLEPNLCASASTYGSTCSASGEPSSATRIWLYIEAPPARIPVPQPCARSRRDQLQHGAPLVHAARPDQQRWQQRAGDEAEEQPGKMVGTDRVERAGQCHAQPCPEVADAVARPHPGRAQAGG